MNAHRWIPNEWTFECISRVEQEIETIVALTIVLCTTRLISSIADEHRRPILAITRKYHERLSTQWKIDTRVWFADGMLSLQMIEEKEHRTSLDIRMCILFEVVCSYLSNHGYFHRESMMNTSDCRNARLWTYLSFFLFVQTLLNIIHNIYIFNLQVFTYHNASQHYTRHHCSIHENMV
jgi:hypothetical protein